MARYINTLISHMDEEGCIVFQGTIMAGYSSRQAVLNAYGMCYYGDELTRDPFTAFHIIADLPKYVADAIFSVSEQEIEDLFWNYHERK